MHVDPFLHRSDVRVYAPDIEERLDVALAEDGGEALARRREAGEAATHLADAYNHIRYGSIEGLRKVVSLCDDGIDEIHFGGEALEEQVAVGCVHVGFDVYLREVWLHKPKRNKSFKLVMDFSAYLDDVEELPSFASLNLLHLQVDMAGLVLRCRRLKLEVERHHCGGLRSCGCGLVLCGLSLSPKVIEFAETDGLDNEIRSRLRQPTFEGT